MKSDLQIYYEEYIKLLERECETAFRRLAKLGHKASPESIVLGEKFRKLIAEAKENE